MRKMIGIGEALIDFIPNRKGCALKDVVAFERVAGGAPANVCAAVSKLGGTSAFISQLGEDAFGEYIVDVLAEVGVETTYVKRTNKAHTGLAFVALKEDGNRDFSFYRNPSADMLLEADDIESAWFEDCGYLHFCSVDLIPSPMKAAHERAIQYAAAQNGIISFDPNVRLPLWPTDEACRQAILEFLPYAHVVKISDEEVAFITGCDTIEAALPTLMCGNVEVVLFTEGGKGARIYTKQRMAQAKGCKITVADTTGAGDAFMGAFLYCLQRDQVTPEALGTLQESTLESYVTFANFYAAYSATGKGAIESYGDLTAITQFAAHYSK